MSEHVVLVDENDMPLGTIAKNLVHREVTPLHRGFSVFLFNSKKELLLQQRSFKKQTWPGVWSNSCCGHPMLNEDLIQAAYRRLQFELGLNQRDLKLVEFISPYRYKFTFLGIMENEICPILVAFSDKKPIINPEEVNDYKFLNWDEFLRIISFSKDEIWSPWCREEAIILNKNQKFLYLLKKFTDASKP